MYVTALIADAAPMGSIVRFSAFLVKRRIGGAKLTLYRTEKYLCARLENVSIEEGELGKGYRRRLFKRAINFLEARAFAECESIHLEVEENMNLYGMRIDP